MDSLNVSSLQYTYLSFLHQRPLITWPRPMVAWKPTFVKFCPIKHRPNVPPFNVIKFFAFYCAVDIRYLTCYINLQIIWKHLVNFIRKRKGTVNKRNILWKLFVCLYLSVHSPRVLWFLLPSVYMFVCSFVCSQDVELYPELIDHVVRTNRADVWGKIQMWLVDPDSFWCFHYHFERSITSQSDGCMRSNEFPCFTHFGTKCLLNQLM